MDTIDDLKRQIADLEAQVQRLQSGFASPPGAVSTPVGRDELFSAIEKTRMPMILTDPNQPDEPIIFANRAFQRLSGYASEELVGRNCRFLQGKDTDPADVARVRAALRDRTDLAIDILNYRRDGTPFVNELYISPVFDADGRLLYNFGSQVDVTGYRRAVADRAAAETRNRQIIDAATDFAVVATDKDGTITEWSRGAERTLGWSADEMVGEDASRFFTPEDRAAGRIKKEMQDALAKDRGVDERWHMKKDGTRFWASGEMTPLRDDNGRHYGFVKILRDRTEQHLTGMRLEELATQLQQAQEAGGVGLFAVDIVSGMIEPTAEFSRLYGLEHQDRRPAADFEATIIAEDRRMVSSDATRRAGTATPDVVYRVRRADTGELRWISRKGGIRFDDAGKPIRFVGIARDVTDRVMADERREVLNAELAHRLKNTLALVSSIVTQTLRTAPDVVSARKTLSDRIQALSKAHDVLLTGQRDAASIREVVRSAASLHDDGDRVRLSGPDVILGPKASLTLALIVHELSTNAGKYGALSVPDGHVDVRWSVDRDPETERSDLALEWREVGGPPVTPPTKRSFGTRLVEMGLSGAATSTSELRYEPDGLVCRIEASLTELQADDETDAGR